MNENVRELRLRTALSQVDFARVLGVSVSSLRRWESGNATPSPLAISKINEVSERNIEELLKPNDIKADSEVISHASANTTFAWNKVVYDATYMPYVVNGPEDQLEFHHKLVELQEDVKCFSLGTKYLRRLSMLKAVNSTTTAQYNIEDPRDNAKCWSSDYGTHGFHRYVGRFPPHLIRAIINHFGATERDIVLDPFCGSGTTLVEARMLGVHAIGIEISPLSALISRVKSAFPDSGIAVSALTEELEEFYTAKWGKFAGDREFDQITYDDIVSRPGNLIKRFPNFEKWFTKEALLGTSIIVEYIQRQQGYLKDFLAVALSAKMRSIGNVDVDVVRAEYRKAPRVGVDVLRLVENQLRKMARALAETLSSHRDIMGQESDITVIEGSALSTTIASNSVSYIVTSPPYGVESLSYLRTYLLSFRVLEPILGVDPYNFDADVVGSEYLDRKEIDIDALRVKNASSTYVDYFRTILADRAFSGNARRVTMMMKFFEDMHDVIQKFSQWIKPHGRVAFIIGNKKIGDSMVPTNRIIQEIFEYCGFSLDEMIEHKLKTNNSNSQVPWQERIIENEYVMLFTKR